MRNLLVSLFGICTLSAQTPDPLVAVDYEAQQQWVDSTYGQLSFDEKIGQLFMVMAFSEQGKEHFDAISKNIDENKIGGVIFSLGGPLGQTDWLNRFQKKSKIPLL